MKTKFILFLTSSFLFSINLSSQTLLNPNKGQFFEQGYGQSSTWNGNEEGIDLVFDQSFNNLGGALMAGWVEDTSEIYDSYDDNVLDAAVWRIGAFGKQRFHFSITGNLNEAATGIINGPANKYAICVRKSIAYNTPETVEIGDSLLVYQFDSLGEIDFVLRYGFTLEGYESTGIAPVDIIYEGEGIYLVLANRIYLQEIGNKIEPVLLRVDQNADIVDLEIYNGYDNSVEAHELFKDNSANIFFSANSLGDTPYPMFFKYNNSLVNQTVKAYSSIANTQVFGLAKHPTVYFAMSGYQVTESDTNAVIITLNEDYNHNQTWNVGLENLTETFRDLNTHAEGIVAVGLRQSDEELGIGEGNKDVFICHFDNTGEITLEETMGSHKNDRVTHTEPHPLQPATFFAGNHTGYGKDSTGNAYLGGILFSDLEGLISGNCKVPRVLFVDNLIGLPIRDNIYGYVNRDILNDQTKEQNLINYCINNNINYISIYRLGAMFDDYHGLIHQDIQDDRNAAQSELNSFIQKCQRANIRVGYIADREQHALLEIITNRIGAFNYNVSGKFNYIQLEHEFWNTENPDYEKILADNSYIYIDNNIDEHHDLLYTEHKNLLTTINSEKASDGNIWKSLDYVAYFYNRASGAVEHSTNATPRKNKTTELANLSDAIFTTYYQEWNSTNEGLDFIEPSTSSDPQLIDYRNRLSDFGNGAIHNIIPTFSAEYYDYNSNPEEFCGKGKEQEGTNWYYYDYLGKFLDGPDFNSTYSTNDFNQVETDYSNQHDVIFQNPPSGFTNITNVNVSAFGWYRYSCIQNKTGFIDKSLISCPVFSSPFPIFPLNDKEAEVKNSGISLYPNPAKDVLNISLSKNEIIQLNFFDLQGRQVYSQLISKINAEINISQLQRGIYIIEIKENNNVVSIQKIVKL